MEYKVSVTNDGYVVHADKKPGEISPVVCNILGHDKELADHLAFTLSMWEEDKKFYRELKELNPVPEPTELEKIQMQANLYKNRLKALKTFIDKIPECQWLISSACRLVLTSIHGSRERAVQAWLHDQAYTDQVRKIATQ